MIIEKIKNQQGVALIELALMLPALILVLVGTLEYTHLIHRYDELSFLTQISAQKTFDDCISDPSVMGSAAIDAVTLCIDNNVGDPMRDELLSQYPGVQVVVSVYQYDAATGVELRGYRVVTRAIPLCADTLDNDDDESIDAAADATCEGSTERDYEDTEQRSPSRYTIARVNAELNVAPDFLIQGTGNLIVAEAILPQDSLMSGLESITGANWSSIYAVSII